MLFFKHEPRFVLDSSSIIDGRVILLFEKKFFEGRIIIPVLVKTIVKKTLGEEADKALTMLKKNCHVEFVDSGFNGFSEEVYVLKIATRRRAKVITASDELCRQARLFPAAKIIDIRELYRTLTPIFAPNKIISLRIIKRGLNSQEGVGYVEGVKVVVEDGARFLNQTVNARVNAMLSFETGNLVFASLAKEFEEKQRTKPVSEKGIIGEGNGISG